MSSERKLAIDKLRALLEDGSGFAENGYEIAIGPRCDLVVSRHGHWRGLWRYASGYYGWIVAGSNGAQVRTDDVNIAVAYTRKNIFVA